VPPPGHGHCCRESVRKPAGIAFAADGRTLTSTSRDGALRVWEVATGKLVHRIAGLSSEVRQERLLGRLKSVPSPQLIAPCAVEEALDLLALHRDLDAVPRAGRHLDVVRCRRQLRPLAAVAAVLAATIAASQKW
jgi:hypothetical protein